MQDREIKVSSLTHQGLVRSNNEDRYIVREYPGGGLLMAVADGMGGHLAGEKAAQIAIDCFAAFEPAEHVTENDLRRLIWSAHMDIQDASLRDPTKRGMGTTITGAHIENGIVRWAHVGDSRLYLFRGGLFIQITEDHTIPGTLLKHGEITKESARTHPFKNMLLKCLGCDNAQADSGSFHTGAGDILFLSTDGLHDLIPEDTIAAILHSSMPLDDKVHAIVSEALLAGGPDNITVIAAQL